MRLTIAVLLIFCLVHTGQAQKTKYIAFTVNDGLPSNHIYRCIEDNKGFLWVATEGGIARFDGKRFQVFTTEQGLADNEVLSVVKEKNGRIWVNMFRQSPAYFDEILNRFINVSRDSEKTGLLGTSLMYLYPLKEGGVIYYNENGSFVFRNTKLVGESNDRKEFYFLIRENSDGSQLRWRRASWDPVLKIYPSTIVHTKGKVLLDSINISRSTVGRVLPAIDEENFNLSGTDMKKFFIYSDFRTNPLRFKLDSISIPEPFFNFGFTSTSLYLVSYTGKLYVFNKRTLKQEYEISGNYLPNSFYNDRKGNLWISTIDKGLIFYKKDILAELPLPRTFIRTNFLSITRKPDGTILGGNYYGEVIEAGNGKFLINTIIKKVPARQRKVLLTGTKTFTFSEEGIAANYGDVIINPANKYPYSVKTAIIYNDSLIIAGAYMGFLKLNSITEKITRLGTVSKRVTAMVKADKDIIYFGSTDGLYKYNFPEDSVSSLVQNDPLLSKRVMALCTTPDKLLWVASPGYGIVVVKNDKVLLNITEKNGIISNSSRSITSGRPGQVWLGTSHGISIINYHFVENKLKFNIQNLSVNDGLSSNEINEMLYQNDTVYAATADGISIIPANISIPKFNIPVHLVGISVNQRDTSLFLRYDLDYNQKNIQMVFSGIELGGHFKNFQYTLNNNRNWITLDENTLAIQLSHGAHMLQVRAVDINGNISNRILSIRFNIETPFWKTIWFWIIIALLIQVPIIYLVNRRQKRRKGAKLAKEIAEVQTASLEQQAFTSLMNPHFMFNALNSVQHYINVQDRQNANRYLSDFASLIRQNFEAAQLSFIPLEQEIENIKIYLRLEKMRFNDRFSYQIVIEEHVDTDEWMIPTMILQPLLENALLHGIMPSAIDGEVLIGLKQQDKNLLITITDNGIGISNSLALKENSMHKSRGMELIRKRITALGRFGPQAITIDMSPAFDSEKNPGNQITLFIPAELHEVWLQAQKK